MRSAVLAAAFLFAVGGLLAQAPQPDPKAPQPPAKQPDPKQPEAKQPAPTPAPAGAVSDFFPAKKGSKWVYKYAEADVTMEVKDSGADVKVDTTASGKVVASEVLKLQADGLYRTKINNLDITPPLKILDMETKDGKLVPKAKGASWPVKVNVQQASLTGTYTIVDTVKLNLPAPLGAVDATLVEAKLNIAGTDTVIRYWFAAGKGQVKISYSIASNEQAMELKTFEEGK